MQMRPINRQTRRSAVMTIGVAVTVCIALTTATATAAKNPVTVLPPNGVYTFPWIATHPAAASQAQVTCDPSVFALAVSMESPRMLDSTD
jgi:hypothetical protein